MIIKHSLLYVGSSIFSKAVPFLLLPALTHYLTPEEFGLFSIYQVFLAFGVAFLGMAIQTNISSNYFKVSKADLSLYFGNIIFILLFNTFLGLILVLLFGLFENNLFSINVEFLYLLPFLVFITAIVELYTTLLRSQKKALKFCFIEVVNTIIRFSIICIFIIFFELGWESFPIGSVIGLSIVSFYCVYSLLKQKYLKMVYNKEKIKDILDLSLPLVPHAIGVMVIVMSDRLFIEKIVGAYEVGIYAVGYSFGMIVSLFSDAYIKAWSPWFYEKMNNLNGYNKVLIVKLTYLYIFLILILSVFVYILSLILIPLITSNEYHSATKYVFWIALAYSVQGIYKIFFPYLVQFSKTKYLAITTMLAAVISLFGNYLFIHQYGAIGATYSMILAFFVSSLCVFIIAVKQVKLPWLLLNKG